MVQQKPNKGARLRKAIRVFHRWLGLCSGLAVVFLGLSGCVLCFEKEIETVTAPYQYVAAQQKPFLPPSRLQVIAESCLHGKKISGIEYPGRGKAAIASYYAADEFYLLFIDPYTGRLIKAKNMDRDFFRIMVNGHYYLWLPHQIGQPVVATLTLVFVIMMISGLILWWPKNRAARRQRFSLKLSASWKRVNYDLHNVLGFYMSWVAVFIAFTGLVWGFQWFARSAYWISSGGRSLPGYEQPVSDTTAAGKLTTYAAIDSIWLKGCALQGAGDGLYINLPYSKTSPVTININHLPGTYFNQDYYYFDQHTLKPLPGKGIYAGTFKDAPVADKISRMNYDLHVGAVLGLPGKILAFFASLVAASLPVTGFLIWRGRRRQTKRS